MAIAGDIGDTGLLAEGLGQAHGILMWDMGVSAIIALSSTAMRLFIKINTSTGENE